MKLKLAYYVMSRAKHLFHPAAKEYDQVGLLIRHRALRASMRCAKLGRNTDVQFHKSLKEFLAFFCAIAVNEIALRSDRQSDEELKSIYEKVRQGICEGHEPDPSLVQHQLTVQRVMTYKKSGFDHWFYGYWNADVEGMRITPQDLAVLEEKGISPPPGNPCERAGLILLIRLARLENADFSIPVPLRLRSYDGAIREEVASFVRALNRLLS